MVRHLRIPYIKNKERIELGALEMEVARPANIVSRSKRWTQWHRREWRRSSVSAIQQCASAMRFDTARASGTGSLTFLRRRRGRRPSRSAMRPKSIRGGTQVCGRRT